MVETGGGGGGNPEGHNDIFELHERFSERCVWGGSRGIRLCQ